MDIINYLYIGLLANIICSFLKIIIYQVKSISFSDNDIEKLTNILRVRSLYMVNNVSRIKLLVNFFKILLPFYLVYTFCYYVYFLLKYENNIDGYIDVIHSMDKINIVNIFPTDIYDSNN